MPSHYGDSDKLIDQQLLENIIRKQSMGPIGSTVNLSSPATTMKIPPAAPPPVMRGSGQTAISPKLTQALMNQGINPGPVTSKTQMFAKMGTAAIGGVLERMRTDDAQEVKSRIAQAISSIPGIPPEMVASVNAIARHDPAAALKIIASERKNAAGEGKFTTEVINGIKYQRGPKGKLDLFPTAKDNRTTAQKNLEARGLIPGSREYTAAMKKHMAKTGGTDVTINNAPPNTKKTISALQTKAMDVVSGLDRIERIQETFQPKFQSIGHRVYISKLRLFAKAQGGIIASALSKIFGSELTDEHRKDLREFRAFEVEALTNVNRYIKEITGAQMSELEAKRIRAALPDPGDKDAWLKFDDPVTFQAGLDQVKSSLRAVLARTIQMQRDGVVGTAETLMVPSGRKNADGEEIFFRKKGVISLKQMKRKISARKNALRSRFKKEGLEGDNLDNSVYSAMQKEFFTPVGVR